MFLHFEIFFNELSGYCFLAHWKALSEATRKGQAHPVNAEFDLEKAQPEVFNPAPQRKGLAVL
jgi:hypothetical protein